MKDQSALWVGDVSFPAGWLVTPKGRGIVRGDPFKKPEKIRFFGFINKLS